MRFKCEPETLGKVLSSLNRTVYTRGILTALSHVLCDVNDQNVQFSATDLAHFVRITMDATDLEPGGVLIPAQLFSEFVNACGDGEIIAQLEGNVLQLITPTHKARLNCMATDQFPQIPPQYTEALTQVNAAEFAEMIHKVEHAAAKDEVRQILMGILVKATPDGVEMVTADGYRLAWCRGDRPWGDGEFSVLVPAASMREWARLCSEGNMTIAVQEDRQVQFNAPCVQMTAQLIAGHFPDYTAIIPNAHDVSVQVDTKQLARAVHVAHLFARDSDNTVKFEVGENELMVSAVSAETGESVTKLDATTTGGPLAIAFNSRYVLDALGTIGTRDTVIEMTTVNRPGVFRPCDDSQQLMVIMPMQLG